MECGILSNSTTSKEWYDRGVNKAENDDVYRFVCLWFSFNSFYGNVYQENEYEQIQKFCTEKEQYLNSLNLFEQKAVSIFFERMIYDERKNAPKNIASERYENLKSRKIQALIMSIYQVRCNLFHGSKSVCNIDDQRNINLIKSSADIMKIILKGLIDNG